MFIHIYIYPATKSLLGLCVFLLLSISVLLLKPVNIAVSAGVQLRGSPLGGYRGPNGGGRWGRRDYSNPEKNKMNTYEIKKLKLNIVKEEFH